MTPPAAAALATLLAGAPALPEGESAPWSLDMCLARAEEVRSEMRERAAEAAGAEAAVEEAEAAYVPDVSASAAYQRIDGAFPGARLASGSLNDFSLGMAASWTATDLAWAPIDVRSAGELAHAAKDSADATRRGIRLEVVGAYHSLWAAHHVAALTRETLDVARAHREYAQARQEVGLGARADVARAEVEIADATVAVASAGAAVEAARAALARAIGLPPTVRIGIEDVEPAPGAVPADPVVAGERPEIRALERQAESARADAEAASAGYWPSVTVGAGWGVRDGDFFPTEQTWYVGASLDVPLLSWLATAPAVDRAEASAAAAEARIETLERDIALEAERARLALVEAKARLDASAALMAGAQENLRVAQGLYREGAGSMIELVDARNAVERAEIVRVTGLRDVAVAAARYRWAVGEEP